ncbi:MAG: folate family ECF transporter S component [Erysipelotrichaceae bacterium]|nr:folate family ECF transporter S component [Erysipelotrichaceae bacterium]
MEHSKNSLFSYKSSSLFNIRVLCGISMFVALNLVLSAFKVSLSSTLRISFTFLATGASCYFFGLFPNLAAAFVCDALGWMIHPDGPYMPLFALTAMLEAAIYSFFFYGRDKIGAGRVIAAKGLTTVLSNLILHPLILSFMYQTPFWVTFSTRLVKNAVLFPVEVFLLYLVLQLCIKLRKRVSWL